MAKQKLSRHKYGGRNNGPSRQAYWRSDRLRTHKIKHIMADLGCTRAEAEKRWNRTKRMKGATAK